MVGGVCSLPFRGIVSETVGNFLPIFSATERGVLFHSEAQICKGTVWKGKGAGHLKLIWGSREVTLNSSGARVEGLPLRACQPAPLLALPALLKDLKMFVREGKGTHKLGDDSRGSQEGRKRVWGEPGTVDHIGLGESLQVSAVAALAPAPPHPRRALGSTAHSSALCCFAFRALGFVGDRGGRASLERLWTLGKLMVVVSEVKFIQVPSALPRLGAPHPA